MCLAKALSAKHSHLLNLHAVSGNISLYKNQDNAIYTAESAVSASMCIRQHANKAQLHIVTANLHIWHNECTSRRCPQWPAICPIRGHFKARPCSWVSAYRNIPNICLPLTDCTNTWHTACLVSHTAPVTSHHPSSQRSSPIEQNNVSVGLCSYITDPSHLQKRITAAPIAASPLPLLLPYDLLQRLSR